MSMTTEFAGKSAASSDGTSKFTSVVSRSENDITHRTVAPHEISRSHPRTNNNILIDFASSPEMSIRHADPISESALNLLLGMGSEKLEHSETSEPGESELTEQANSANINSEMHLLNANFEAFLCAASLYQLKLNPEAKQSFITRLSQAVDLEHPSTPATTNDAMQEAEAKAIAAQADLEDLKNNHLAIVDRVLRVFKEQGAVNENCGWCKSLRELTIMTIMGHYEEPSYESRVDCGLP